VYIEYDSFDYEKIKILKDCMHEAFTFYFDSDLKEAASLIRLDVETWSRDYKEDKIEQYGMKIKQEKIHIDERNIEEYHKYKKYFKRNPALDL
jgi:hypothetical protein